MRSAFISSLIGVALTLGLVSCESFPVLPYFPVVGDYRLSGKDIWQIAQLPSRAGITRPIDQITANTADEATVYCGIPGLKKSELTVFTARRKDDRWFIDKQSIHTEIPIPIH